MTVKKSLLPHSKTFTVSYTDTLIAKRPYSAKKVIFIDISWYYKKSSLYKYSLIIRFLVPQPSTFEKSTPYFSANLAFRLSSYPGG
jgi:hypothetical protein